MICALFCCFVFFFNDTAPTEIYTLSLHDALPISSCITSVKTFLSPSDSLLHVEPAVRSEEHTSELQSHLNLVCRLLFEKKNNIPPRLFQWLEMQSDCLKCTSTLLI